MQTRPCPNCHEIIPADVDYCPFCGQSTRETIHTEDDLALARQTELRESEPPPPDALNEQGGKLPPVAGQINCMMCHLHPATIGDYCVDCKAKLDMGPEQWDLAKQDAQRRTMTTVGVVVVVIAVLLILIFSRHFSRHAALSIDPTPHVAAALPKHEGLAHFRWI